MHHVFFDIAMYIRMLLFVQNVYLNFLLHKNYICFALKSVGCAVAGS